MYDKYRNKTQSKQEQESESINFKDIKQSDLASKYLDERLKNKKTKIDIFLD